MLRAGFSFACLRITQVKGYISDQGYAKLLNKRLQNFCEMVGSLHLSKSQLGYNEEPKFLYN
jgi:hypothetical protein